MPLPPTITDASVTLTFGAAGQYYGYCTIKDVLAELSNMDSFTSLWPQPGNGDGGVMSNGNSIVAQLITATAQELQDQLARIYQMPYAGTDGGILETLRKVNASLAYSELLDRYMKGSEPDESPAAATARSWAELILVDIQDGVIQWAPPFGDAVPMAERPTYPLAAGATILPDPTSLDPYVANPIFTLGQRSRFRRGGVL